MAGYHSPQVEVEVRLNTNESPEPPPAAFVEELSAAVAEIAWNRYPDRQAAELRAALSSAHGLGPDEVFCANGSNEALQCLLLAYGGPGRRCLVFEPTYALHGHLARLTGTEVVAAGRGEGFCVDADEAVRLAADHEVSVVFLCSPNNPTGNAEPVETVRALCEATRSLVVVDEAYVQFAHRSALELFDEAANLVVVRTFSKTWALAGLRLGYLLARAGVVAACEAVALPYHLDAVKQRAGVAALAHAAEMDARVARLVEQRGVVEAGLGELLVDFWPSEANFVLFRPRERAAAAVWAGLVERSVLVRDVSSFPGLDNCLRVTIGTASENRRFLEALSVVLAALGRDNKPAQ